MLKPIFLMTAALVIVAATAQAQIRRVAPAATNNAAAAGSSTQPPASTANASGSANGTNFKWRTSSGVVRASGESPLPPAAQPLPTATPAAAQTPIARVTRGPDSLPTDAGQEWRDYDISSLHDAGHFDQSARTGDRRLDLARDGLRSLAHRARWPS